MMTKCWLEVLVSAYNQPICGLDTLDLQPGVIFPPGMQDPWVHEPDAIRVKQVFLVCSEMSDNKQRCAIKSCLRLGHNTTETFAKLQQAYGDGVLPRDQNHLKRHYFGTQENIKTAVTDQLKAIPISEFHKCYEEWKKRLQRCVASEGSYFEGDNVEFLASALSSWNRDSSLHASCFQSLCSVAQASRATSTPSIEQWHSHRSTAPESHTVTQAVHSPLTDCTTAIQLGGNLS
ncbi:putative transposase [Trichonephila clavipes]|nr:putative transposase [Trichonephila clavipes]